MSLSKLLELPGKILFKLGISGYIRFLDDETYLKMMYRCRFHKKLDLQNPKTFNEKLQWLKLHDRNPEYTQMVDKYLAKQYIAERIGEEYIIPTLGVWDRFDEIDFDALPDQFVLKCTHDSGGLVICTDKAKLDRVAAKKKIEKSLRRNYYYTGREWPYKNVKPRIIAEAYMEDTDESGAAGQQNCLTDYKFFCFNGQPKIVYVSKDKAAEPRTDFFDMDFNALPIQMRDPKSDVLPEKPALFDEMKRIAGLLSQGRPHLRVDFYQINNRLYVGELTFYHFSGMALVKPAEWNMRLGDWIILPKADGAER